MEFIALDFETANRYPNSACSLGIIYVNNQTIVDEKYFLIQPPIMKFDAKNIAVHGIKPDDVKEAPKFDEVWETIKHDFDGSMIIAHNAHFDMSVLHACLKEYDIALPDLTYCCSIPISNRAIKGQRVKQSLVDRASYFGIDLQEHHHALADARACAELVLKSIEASGLDSFPAYLDAHPSLPIKQLHKLKPMTSFNKEKAAATNKFTKTIKISDIKPTIDINENSPLLGKTFVLTGDLDSMDRTDAMQIIVNFGGILKSSVSKKTDYLIFGRQDKTLVGDKGISSKYKKARELHESGSPIELLDEAGFLRLLTEAQSSTYLQQ